MASQIRVKFITDERECQFLVKWLLQSAYKKEGKGECDTKGRGNLFRVVRKNVSF